MAQEPIILDWQDKHAELFGNHMIRLKHRLHESPIFTDEALARLIERIPREHYHVNTMNQEFHDPTSWRDGEISGVSGEEVLAAVRGGKIWVLLQRVAEVDAGYKAALDQVFAEFEEKVPGLKTFKQKMSILISSPKIQVYYHCDIPGQSLWQIRGRKRVYIYPNTAPFLRQEAMEKIVLNEADEQDTPYQPWFDDYAQIVDLEPGEMLHWPINGPHRVVNYDCLNISFTTEHWTTALRNRYANHYANGILRRSFGVSNPQISEAGPALWAKLALAGAHRFTGMQKKNRLTYKVDFRVDPKAPFGMRDIEAYELAK
ncbi:cupin-like domain-containing protein [Afifella sp. IM 167]|uniref:cupin-like domain-containing protein n=1 Tax=Afifella sp. IM 167 TaxID=2033586 RepID=UPI001CCEA879|nr:cupin-like domain-containing protein [Afifella sp. IM 167]MBZ8132456.1 hypothetical protein [Afifella sp. IM 167]